VVSAAVAPRRHMNAIITNPSVLPISISVLRIEF
jgi:hypothetical protein